MDPGVIVAMRDIAFMTNTIGNRALVIALATMAATASPSLAAESYCSESGDVCTSAAKRSGVRFIEFRTFALRGWVRVCLDSNAEFNCRPFRLRRDSGTDVWAFKKRIRRHWPTLSPGVHRVTFFKAGQQVGPSLTFRDD